MLVTFHNGSMFFASRSCFKHKYIYIHIHIYIHMYMYTYIFMCVCVCVWEEEGRRAERVVVGGSVGGSVGEYVCVVCVVCVVLCLCVGVCVFVLVAVCVVCADSLRSVPQDKKRSSTASSGKANDWSCSRLVLKP